MDFSLSSPLPRPQIYKVPKTSFVTICILLGTPVGQIVIDGTSCPEYINHTQTVQAILKQYLSLNFTLGFLNGLTIQNS